MGRATRKPRNSRAAGSPKAHRPADRAPAAPVPVSSAPAVAVAGTGTKHGPPQPAAAEAVLVLHYARLARLAYTVLPGSLDPHSRVLAAHSLVQRALPHRWPDLLKTHQPRVPVPRSSPEGTAAPADPAYAHLRATVLAAALRDAPRRPGLLPRVWGLRLFPASSGADGLVLERELAALSAAERAAYALLALEELSPAVGLRTVAGRGGQGARGRAGTGRWARCVPSRTHPAGAAAPTAVGRTGRRCLGGAAGWEIGRASCRERVLRLV